MIVIAIIGILTAALFPSFANYIQRGRDASRLSNIDNLGKWLALYFSENEKYPLSDAQGCVNNAALSNYLWWKNINDPQPAHSNGCGTVWLYGYAMSTTILSNPNVFSLLAIMEQPKWWNYSGSLVWFTGTLTQSAYNTGLLYTIKWDGAYYIRIP